MANKNSQSKFSRDT